MKTLKAGDRVAYSAAFLRSIGAQTGDAGFVRGTYQGEQKVGQRMFARVLWDGDDEPKLVCRPNIAPVGPNMEFCAC